MNKTTLAKYVWEIKQKHHITATLQWYIVKSVSFYSNITKSHTLGVYVYIESLI